VERDVASYGTFLRGIAEAGDVVRVMQMLEDMQQLGHPPNQVKASIQLQMADLLAVQVCLGAAMHACAVRSLKVTVIQQQQHCGRLLQIQLQAGTYCN
jgi:pentatricopeptide repeat protein